MSEIRKKRTEKHFLSRWMPKAEPPRLADSHYIEIRCHRRGKEAFLSSVERIVSYSDSEITLRFCGENIVFSGEGLYLSTFRSGVVSIAGRIRSITVKGGRNVFSE